MIVIFLLIPLSIVIATGFLWAFVWAVRSGQYEDTCTPAMRVLVEEKNPAANISTTNQNTE
jgi:cbb3-type cytochrome oxidase maturation protein